MNPLAFRSEPAVAATAFRDLVYPDSVLALELTDHCNARCIMCSQSTRDVIHGTTKGFMPRALLREILDDVERTGVRFGKLLPFGLGESTLHPEFGDLMSDILERNRGRKLFRQIDFHTNAIRFGEAIANLLIDHADQFGTITFSLDAVTLETYRIVRGNPSFQAARDNTRRYFEIRKRRGGSSPHAVIQFIVMAENRHEAAPFVAEWSGVLRDLGIPFQVNYDWDPPMVRDTIFLKRVAPFERVDVETAERLHREVVGGLGLLPTSAATDVGRHLRTPEFFESTALPPRRRPCSGPFKYLDVSWDGLVTVCCLDTARELEVGTVGTDGPLSRIWMNARMETYRRGHIENDYASMPKCALCKGLDGPAMTDDQIRDYARSRRIPVP